MRLIGMLVSPYVRRVAICLEYLGVTFDHEALSVFTTFDKFHSINPVVKAPTLLCDDGELIMDSSLILQYVERLISKGRSLWPQDPANFQHDMRAVSLALAACDKSVQIVYERNLRPKSAQYEPWLNRAEGQLLAAYAGLEQEIVKRPEAFSAFSNASITAASAWTFTQSELSAIVSTEKHPELSAMSKRFEATGLFLKYPPVGPGVAIGV